MQTRKMDSYRRRQKKEIKKGITIKHKMAEGKTNKNI